jgi:hypothetical protein
MNKFTELFSSESDFSKSWARAKKAGAHES